MTSEDTVDDTRLSCQEARIAELALLEPVELKARFWALADQVVAPLVELARNHTSPSIERSVLLRMGIDSLTSQAVVQHVYEAGHLGRGAGHAVLRLARRDHDGDLRAAAAAIAADASVLDGLFAADGAL